MLGSTCMFTWSCECVLVTFGKHPLCFLGDYFEKMWPSRENSEIKGESRFFLTKGIIWYCCLLKEKDFDLHQESEGSIHYLSLFISSLHSGKRHSGGLLCVRTASSSAPSWTGSVRTFGQWWFSCENWYWRTSESSVSASITRTATATLISYWPASPQSTTTDTGGSSDSPAAPSGTKRPALTSTQSTTSTAADSYGSSHQPAAGCQSPISPPAPAGP